MSVPNLPKPVYSLRWMELQRKIIDKSAKESIDDHMIEKDCFNVPGPQYLETDGNLPIILPKCQVKNDHLTSNLSGDAQISKIFLDLVSKSTSRIFVLPFIKRSSIGPKFGFENYKALEDERGSIFDIDADDDLWKRIQTNQLLDDILTDIKEENQLAFHVSYKKAMDQDWLFKKV